MEISFGVFVRRRRKSLGYRTQADLAGAAGLSRDYISWIELGKAAPTRLETKTVDGLARALRIDPDLLRRWSNAGAAPADAIHEGDLALEEAYERLSFPQVVVKVMRHRELVKALLGYSHLSEAFVARMVAALGPSASEAEYVAFIQDCAL